MWIVLGIFSSFWWFWGPNRVWAFILIPPQIRGEVDGKPPTRVRKTPNPQVINDGFYPTTMLLVDQPIIDYLGVGGFRASWREGGGGFPVYFYRGIKMKAHMRFGPQNHNNAVKIPKTIHTRTKKEVCAKYLPHTLAKNQCRPKSVSHGRFSAVFRIKLHIYWKSEGPRDPRDPMVCIIRQSRPQ